MISGNGPPHREEEAIDETSHLMQEFLLWIAARPRTYAETMDAWRSHCPRHTIWEDAMARGLIRIEQGGDAGSARVSLTPGGHALLGPTPTE